MGCRIGTVTICNNQGTVIIGNVGNVAPTVTGSGGDNGGEDGNTGAGGAGTNGNRAAPAPSDGYRVGASAGGGAPTPRKQAQKCPPSSSSARNGR